MAQFGEENKFVFQAMNLYNYKMHKHTHIDFTDAPINVISGANGSGKTQILEALILALGYTPTRVALGKISDVVGPFDNICKIQLSFANPIISTHRVLSSSDPEILPFVEHDKFMVEVVIGKDETVKRHIISTEGKKKQIKRKQLQQLLKSIGIHENSRLNFTEEGSLGAFAEGSPHQKFNTLLKATGMGDIYASYIESKRKLEEKQKFNTPLKLQYEKEKQKLTKYRENYEKITKKHALISRFQELEAELAWFDVNENENQQKEVKHKIETTISELEKITKELNDYEKKLGLLHQSLAERKRQLQKYQDEAIELEGEKNRLIGKLEGITNLVSSQRARYDELNAKIDEWKVMQTEKGKEKYLQVKQEIEQIRKELSKIETKLIELNNEKRQKVAEKETILQKKKERYNLLQSISRYEMDLIKDTMKIKQAIAGTPYEKQIIGPVFTVIKIKENYQDLEQVVKQAIGKHLYGFVATTHESYEALKRIYDKLFPEKKPNITVARVLEDESSPIPEYLLKKKLTSKPNGIIDHTTELIEAPFHVKLYLNRFINIVIAEPFLSTNFLTDYAKTHKVNVLTTDGKSYFLPQEAFTRPPRPYFVSLYKDNLEQYVFASRIDARIEEIKKRLIEIQNEILQLNLQKGQLQIEYKEFEVELKKWQLSSDDYLAILSKLEKELNDISNEIENNNRIKIELENKIADFSERLAKLSSQQRDVGYEFDELRVSINSMEKKRSSLKQQQYALKQSQTKDQMLLDELKNTYQELIEIAKTKGAIPEKIRDNREEILEEFNMVKGQLELLDITPDIDEQTLKAQEEKVKQLEIIIEEDRIHEENLKSDLNKRLKNWEQTLQNVITHLNNMLNLLLKDVFQEISIAICNYQNAERAELIISALTKGNQRNYRQLSGGEKTLIGQAIILALHMINQSPIHAIDEFTQKLDKKNRALAFSMVSSIYRMAKENRILRPQFLLICPTLDDIELSEDFSHKIMIETVVR
ncbi:MAG: AAA family ATPase [Candidatus Heimdallarchaeaceae archaeon]